MQNLENPRDTLRIAYIFGPHKVDIVGSMAHSSSVDEVHVPLIPDDSDCHDRHVLAIALNPSLLVFRSDPCAQLDEWIFVPSFDFDVGEYGCEVGEAGGLVDTGDAVKTPSIEELALPRGQVETDDSVDALVGISEHVVFRVWA